MNKFFSALLAISILLGSSPAAFARTKYITIGTAGVTGIFYPTGGAIAKIVNRKRREYKIRATVESTAGSVFNVNALMAGDLEFGVVQSDRQYQGTNGVGDWKDKGPQKKLRAVFALHPETVNIIAADDSGIDAFADLKGKTVIIGNPGSGPRGNAIDALTAGGIDWKKDLNARGIKAAESAKMLQDGRVDAFFYTVGHPNGSIQEATSGRRKVHFVQIPEKVIGTLVNKHPYYARVNTPISHYPNVRNKKDLPSFGMKGTFVTSSDVPERIVYLVTKEIFENLEEFKKLHPALAVLTPKNMLEGNSAPYHRGALKYYKEAGLIK